MCYSFKSHLNAKSFNMFLTLQQLKKARYSAPVSVGRVMWTYKGHVSAASGENWKEYQQKLHLTVVLTKSEWDVSERSQSDFHWDRHLRDLLEKSQKRCLFCDVFKTSQKHLKKDVFCVTSLRRLEHISKKMSFPWRLWDVSKTSLASIFGFPKICHKNDFVWFP